MFMEINAQYDLRASELSGKLAFYCNRFELNREDMKELRKKKLVKGVDPDSLPKTIPCQVLVYCENYRQAKVVFFNPEFPLPEECYENHLLNQELIEWSRKYG